MNALTAQQANRAFYHEHAAEYDSTEDCVVDLRLQQRLRQALDYATRHVPANPRVLDACGGTGNASLILLEYGLRPITVDVSPEMLAIFRRKAVASNYQPATVVSGIDQFLQQDSDRQWDFIVFASALHHLEDYTSTLDLALQRLTPRGLVLTIFDPAKLSRVGQALRRLDYIAHVAIHSPARVPRIIYRRCRDKNGASSVGALAERYAMSGIDDQALVVHLRRRGVCILRHQRWYTARFRMSEALLRAARQPSNFHLVLRQQ